MHPVPVDPERFNKLVNLLVNQRNDLMTQITNLQMELLEARERLAALEPPKAVDDDEAAPKPAERDAA